MIARGDEVTALDNLSTGRAENVAALEGPAGKGKFRLQVGDIPDVDALATAVNGVDRVYSRREIGDGTTALDNPDQHTRHGKCSRSVREAWHASLDRKQFCHWVAFGVCCLESFYFTILSVLDSIWEFAAWGARYFSLTLLGTTRVMDEHSGTTSGCQVVRSP